MFYNYNKYGQIWELICNCIQATYWSLLFVLWSAFPKNAHKNFYQYFGKHYIFICLMLLIAGVEPNPGPTPSSSRDGPPAKKEVFYKIM
jgi:hypothetical protein